MRKAFFLDRDGTINQDFGYVGNPDDVQLLRGAAEAIRRINCSGYLVIVVSNQSGVARGYFSLDDVKLVNKRINDLLSKENAHIDYFYICPHLIGAPIKQYDLDCDCRKPKLGLFKKAISELNLDVSQCYACGDKKRDVENLHLLGFPQSHLSVIEEDGGLLRFVNEVFM